MPATGSPSLTSLAAFHSAKISLLLAPTTPSSARRAASLPALTAPLGTQWPGAVDESSCLSRGLILTPGHPDRLQAARHWRSAVLVGSGQTQSCWCAFSPFSGSPLLLLGTCSSPYSALGSEIQRRRAGASALVLLRPVFLEPGPAPSLVLSQGCLGHGCCLAGAAQPMGLSADPTVRLRAQPPAVVPIGRRIGASARLWLAISGPLSALAAGQQCSRIALIPTRGSAMRASATLPYFLLGASCLGLRWCGCDASQGRNHHGRRCAIFWQRLIAQMPHLRFIDARSRGRGGFFPAD